MAIVSSVFIPSITLMDGRADDYNTVVAWINSGFDQSKYVLKIGQDESGGWRRWVRIQGPPPAAHVWPHVWAALDRYEAIHGEVTGE